MNREDLDNEITILKEQIAQLQEQLQTANGALQAFIYVRSKMEEKEKEA